jgi:hypothetical protein
LRVIVGPVRVRKILRSRSALVVALPPDWLRGNALVAGDRVELAYDEVVRVRPFKEKLASSAGGANPGAPARRPAQRAETDEGGLVVDGT